VPGTAGTVDMRGYDSIRALYGNEILNGQGSALADYKAVHVSLCANPDTSSPTCTPSHTAPAEPLGRPVPPGDAIFPSDPVVLARSVVSVTRPAADEAANAPIFDVGANATFDDFDAPIGGSSDAVMTSLHHETRLEGAGAVGGGAFGDEYYWARQRRQQFQQPEGCADLAAPWAPLHQLHGLRQRHLGQRVLLVAEDEAARARPERRQVGAHVLARELRRGAAPLLGVRVLRRADPRRAGRSGDQRAGAALPDHRPAVLLLPGRR
jgi:hypothetical protein